VRVIDKDVVSPLNFLPNTVDFNPGKIYLKSYKVEIKFEKNGYFSLKNGIFQFKLMSFFREILAKSEQWHFMGILKSISLRAVNFNLFGTESGYSIVRYSAYSILGSGVLYSDLVLQQFFYIYRKDKVDKFGH
jgi:hypothetical protein